MIEHALYPYLCRAAVRRKDKVVVIVFHYFRDYVAHQQMPLAHR